MHFLAEVSSNTRSEVSNQLTIVENRVTKNYWREVVTDLHRQDRGDTNA